MTIYRLRDTVNNTFYEGSGRFGKKGRIYTNKGHIRNSLTQTWGRNYAPNRQSLEIVTYDLSEIKAEPL